MSHYTEKAQVLFTKDQFEGLQEVSKKTGKKLGRLLREAAEILYLKSYRRHQISKAADQILSMRLPSTDWPQFKKEYSTKKYSP